MPKDTQEYFIEKIEDYLKTLYPSQGNTIDKTNFINALNYTLHAGGKRIRPLLCLLFAELSAYKTNTTFHMEDILPCAAALEMVHTYSLIHDDLPCMDDDDLRRGKPTCHKAFDEATALLAGDALLTDAFTLFTKASFSAEPILKALHLFSMCIGSKGMIAGQVLDLAMEERATNNIDKHDIEILTEMNARKTGDLLLVACCVPALLYQTDTVFYEECETFAKHFGLAFQITDDILDVVGNTALMGKPQGSDISAGKTTWVSLLGLEKAQENAHYHIETARENIFKWKASMEPTNQAIPLLLKLLNSLEKRVQ